MASKCQWTLCRGHGRNSTSPLGSASEDSPDLRFEMDEDLGVYLVVNGERARSKRTGETYDQLVGVNRVEETMEFTMENGKVVRMPVDEADINAMSQEFPAENFTQDDLSLSIQPLLHSTPRQRPRPRPLQEARRKRQKVMGSSHTQNRDGKFKGVVEVPLATIKKAAKGLTLVEPSHSRVKAFKGTIMSNKGIHLPVLPVMVDGGTWEQENPEKASYILLGGYSLWEALVDISSDEKYQCYRRVLVKVYEGLTAVEALQVGALFQQEQSLLVDDTPTLQAKVALCRRLLYAMHGTDETEEPPSSVKLEWRTQAAASLGFAASSRKELKPLEATFQMALYSKRCYEKLMRVFKWYEEENGKPMKQSMFISLQGVKEEERFSILTKIVNGEMKTEDVKKETWRMKRLASIKHMFVQLTNKGSWEECCRNFPAHTLAPALDHFLNMDFKKAVPMEFVEYVRDAQKSVESGSSSFEHLRMDPVALTVIQVMSGVECPRFTAVSGGLRHTLVVSTDGQLWTWGAGKKGQLGWTDTKMRVPHQWNKPVHKTGILYVWGCNKWSQLAQPKSPYPVPTPQRLDPALFDGFRIKGIYSGWTHMLAVTEDNSVYTWGRNDYGQLGRPAAKTITNGSTESETNATEADTSPGCCHVPTEISILNNASQIVCGAEHSLAITSDDKLLAWGWNEHGMCADGTKTNVHLPKQVQGLDGHKASRVGVGAGHCFAYCQ